LRNKKKEEPWKKTMTIVRNEVDSTYSSARRERELARWIRREKKEIEKAKRVRPT